MIRSKEKRRERMRLIIERLKTVYPSAECALEYGGDPWRLLVMARLSAQCTDERVNIVSRELFSRFGAAEEMKDAPLSEIEEIVKPCGLYKKKAENIKEASRILVEELGGSLPADIDALVKLPGVGRKIANLIVGDVYGGDAVVCDTHCMRICRRFGMYGDGVKDPYKIELILRDLIDGGEGSDFCHRIVFFGREYCSARAPRCGVCPLLDLCYEKEKQAEKCKNGGCAE